MARTGVCRRARGKQLGVLERAGVVGVGGLKGRIISVLQMAKLRHRKTMGPERNILKSGLEKI